MSSQAAPSRGRGGDGGRSSRGRDNNRTPQGGRGGGSTTGGGGGGGPQPVKVHSGSGVPFGYVPAYLPGSASLVEELNQKVMLVLRDGKHLVGTLVSYDQFSNMIFEDAAERRIVTSQGVCYYHDVPLGVYIVRGDSMVLMGELNEIREQMVMREVSLEELEKLERKEAGEDPLEWDFDHDLIV